MQQEYKIEIGSKKYKITQTSERFRAGIIESAKIISSWPQKMHHYVRSNIDSILNDYPTNHDEMIYATIYTYIKIDIGGVEHYIELMKYNNRSTFKKFIGRIPKNKYAVINNALLRYKDTYIPENKIKEIINTIDTVRIKKYGLITILVISIIVAILLFFTYVIGFIYAWILLSRSPNMSFIDKLGRATTSWIYVGIYYTK